MRILAAAAILFCIVNLARADALDRLTLKRLQATRDAVAALKSDWQELTSVSSIFD